MKLRNLFVLILSLGLVACSDDNKANDCGANVEVRTTNNNVTEGVEKKGDILYIHPGAKEKLRNDVSYYYLKSTGEVINSYLHDGPDDDSEDTNETLTTIDLKSMVMKSELESANFTKNSLKSKENGVDTYDVNSTQFLALVKKSLSVNSDDEEGAEDFKICSYDDAALSFWYDDETGDFSTVTRFTYSVRVSQRLLDIWERENSHP